MRATSRPAIVTAAFFTINVNAAVLYIVQGTAAGPFLSPATLVLWTTDAFFVNKGTSTETVRFLGVSNGGWSRGSPTIDLPPARTATLSRAIGGNLAPTDPSILWIVRAEVPATVEVESDLFIGSFFNSPGAGAPPFQSPYRFGRARLPVFKALVSPNERQYHLSTFLGDPQQIPSRLNVAVYNGGSVRATAQIEVRQHCDDTVIDSQTVSIPADTLQQFGGFRTIEKACPPYTPQTLGGPPDSIYTVVTVDQPSISFVSNLANGETPKTTIAVTIPSR